MKRSGFLLFLLTACVSISRSSTMQNRPSSSKADETAVGNRLFVAHCAVCHGIGGSGGRGPSLNHPKLRRVSTDSSLVALIREGVGTEMPPAWQLTDREVRQLAAYVRSLGLTPAIEVPGDPARGRDIYESKGNCSSCHMIAGRGSSLGPDLTDIGIRRSRSYLGQALIEPGAAAPDGFLVVTVVARDGSQVRGMRVSEDSFTIQVRDQDNRFHSFRKPEIADLKKEFGVSLMPSYRSGLNNSELDDLVAYLATLRGEP